MNVTSGTWPNCDDGKVVKEWLERDQNLQNKLIPFAWQCWDKYMHSETGTAGEHPYNPDRWHGFIESVPEDDFPVDPDKELNKRFRSHPPFVEQDLFGDRLIQAILSSGHRDVRAWQTVLSVILEPVERAEWHIDLEPIPWSSSDPPSKNLTGEFPLRRDLRACLEAFPSKRNAYQDWRIRLTGPQTIHALWNIADSLLQDVAISLWYAVWLAAGGPIRRVYAADHGTPAERRNERVNPFAFLDADKTVQPVDSKCLEALEPCTLFREALGMCIQGDLGADPLRNRVRRALMAFGLIPRQSSDGLRTLLAMTALEILLVRDNKEPLTHVISQRAAVLLVPTAAKRPDAIDYIKKLYDRRSDFVHGRADAFTGVVEAARAERVAAGAIIATILWAAHRRDVHDPRTQCEDSEAKKTSEQLYFDAIEVGLFTGQVLRGPPSMLSRELVS